MARNLTVRIDETVLRQARQLAGSEDLSLSQWISRLITRTVHRFTDFQRARRRAVRRLRQGLHLGGAPLSRKNLHAR